MSWLVPQVRKAGCLCVFLCCAGALAAPAQEFRGALRGVVQDARGGRVPAAKIVVQAAESSLRREASSDTRGEFRLDDLLPGAYRLRVIALGFAEASAQVSVVVSSVREITVTLKPLTVQETVIVDGPGSITTQPLDTTSAVHQAIITAHDLETIPLAARSFANIAYLAPGTEPLEPSDPTKARITAVSTGGSSGLNNELSVDGGDNSDDWIGGFLQNFSPDAIQEFAMRTAQEDADTGGTTAASVVITTKHGKAGPTHYSLRSSTSVNDINRTYPLQRSWAQGTLGVDPVAATGDNCNGSVGVLNFACRTSWGAAIGAGTPVYCDACEKEERDRDRLRQPKTPRFDEGECGGAFDGFAVTSDAGPGL